MSKCHPALQAVEYATFHHLVCPAEQFFGRLEDERVASAQVLGPSLEDLSDAQQDRCVGIVTAGPRRGTCMEG